MNGFLGFLKGFASIAMAVVIIIGLVGAAVSADIVFKVCGIAGLIVWLIICGRSLRAHSADGKGHTNRL